MPNSKPRIGISSCLLGEKVRYDGQHKRDLFLTETLGPFVDWIAVCPEFEAGMGVPREPVRLVGSAEKPSLIAERSHKDWTHRMSEVARSRVQSLRKMNLSGYILKKDSPSCGMERVRVYPKRGGIPSRNGRGLFAAALLRAIPLLPVEEEGRLCNPRLRENFIERVFAYQRWQDLASSSKGRRALVEFHARHKLILLAHSEPHLRRLGRLVAVVKGQPIKRLIDAYGRLFMEGLGAHATVRKHVNVLQHMLGFFSSRLGSGERLELIEVIRDYHRGLIPLIAPITLIRHYVKRFRIAYLESQFYLQPHPKELMLRNHV